MMRALERLRRRCPWLDHALRAQKRYDGSQGDFYAAGITYFTIFALFPVLMVGFAVVGFVLASRPQVLAEIDSRVKSAVPGEFGEQIIGLMDAAIASRTSVGVIGLATALYVGLLWMQRMRVALSQMWGQQFPPPGFLNTKMSDVIALVAAFLASLLTIGFSVLATSALRLTGFVRLGSLVVSILVAWLLFTVMIARLPHDPVPLRRCAGAGLLAAVGFETFKQVGSIYLQTVLHGPAGAVFGPVLGLMVFAYMTARLVLFATAWAAERGEAPSSGAVVGSE
ncbi:MAG: inner membrane protein YhjD [Actinomycetota bacterium]|nr:inner membrane protein YhjD [Actinomycetota bacterium]